MWEFKVSVLLVLSLTVDLLNHVYRGLNYAVLYQLLFAVLMSILACSHYCCGVQRAGLEVTLARVGLTRINPGSLVRDNNIIS